MCIVQGYQRDTILAILLLSVSKITRGALTALIQREWNASGRHKEALRRRFEMFLKEERSLPDGV